MYVKSINVVGFPVVLRPEELKINAIECMPAHWPLTLFSRTSMDTAKIISEHVQNGMHREKDTNI
jgi:hypothetical protein